MEETIHFPRGGGGGKEATPPSSDTPKKKLESTKLVRHPKKKPPSQPSDHHHHPDTNILFGKKRSPEEGRTSTNHNNSKKKTKKNPQNEPDTPKASSSSQSVLPIGGGGCRSLHKQQQHHQHQIDVLDRDRMVVGLHVLGICTRVTTSSQVAIFALPQLWSAYLLLSSRRMIHVHDTWPLEIVKVTLETGPGGTMRRRIQVAIVWSEVSSLWMLDAWSRNTSHNNSNSSSKSVTNNNNSTILTGHKVRAVVRSFQDHGILLDIGDYTTTTTILDDDTRRRTGFLLYADIHVPYEIIRDDDDDDIKHDTSTPAGVLRIHTHRLLECVIQPSSSSSSSSSTGILSLTIPARISQVAHPLSHTNHHHTATSLSQLIPGTLITNLVVEQTMTNGLAVAFGPNQMYRGAIDMSHIPGTYSLSYHNNNNNLSNNNNNNKATYSWQDYYLIHQRILPRARIIALDTVTKVLRLSLLPHLLDLDHYQYHHPTSLSVGTRIPHCTVVRVDPHIGAVLALPAEFHHHDDDHHHHHSTDATTKTKHKSKKPMSLAELAHMEASKVQVVYVPMSKAMDSPDGTNSSNKTDTTKAFLKQFAVQSQHTVRIMQQDEYLMDGIRWTGGTAPRILSAHVLSHADLVPGRVMTQVPVLSLVRPKNDQHTNGEDISVLVDFGLGVHGLIPSWHLLDANRNYDNDHPEARRQAVERKYTVGTKLDVRILRVDPVHLKCWCTGQKAMVKARMDQMITSYDDIQSRMGQVVVGFISKIDETKGLCVTFCNNVFGRVPIRSLQTELGMDSISENYARGDVVPCRIVRVKQRRITAEGRSSARFHRENDDDDDGDGDVNDMDLGDADNDDENKKNRYCEVTLSLLVDGLDTTPNEAGTVLSPIDSGLEGKVPLSVGMVLPLNSLRVVEMVPGKDKGRQNGFVPGYAIVSIRSKYLLNENDAGAATGMLPPFVECKLPYDQLLDTYTTDQICTVEQMDEIAKQMLFIGKKINRKGLLLTDPKKTCYEYTNGIGTFAVVTIRPTLINVVEHKKRKKRDDNVTENDVSDETNMEDVLLPGPQSHFHVGTSVIGYVATIDERHGAFVRFLDGLTGLVPKTHHGLQLQLYSTVVVTVIAVDDKFSPPKILLGIVKEMKEPMNGRDGAGKTQSDRKLVERPPLKAGDIVNDAIVDKLDFHRATISILDKQMIGFEENVKVQLHCTMVRPSSTKVKHRKKKQSTDDSIEQVITSHHPFFKWKVGDKLSNLHVLTVERRGKNWIVELTDRNHDETKQLMEQMEHLSTGDKVSAIVSGISKQKGLWIELSPTITAHVPALEMATDVDVLNNMERHFPIGSRIEGVVLDKSIWEVNRHKYYKVKSKDEAKSKIPFVSILGCDDSKSSSKEKPEIGALVVGRVDKTLPSLAPPDLMLDLRHGFIGRCCISELVEADDWTNFPLGHSRRTHKKVHVKNSDGGEEDEKIAHTDGEIDGSPTAKAEKFQHGTFVQCRVVAIISSKPIVEVSLRPSRLEGDMEDDNVPEVGDTVQAFVVETSKKGCFLRLGRHIEGRTILKELCDGFLPDPAASFPTGRLVVGQVKSIRDGKRVNGVTKVLADIDMRGSVIVNEAQKKARFDDLEIGNKYRASVMRIEDYGVFVKLENCDVSGLVHKSECSDKFIKNLEDLYYPGDIVKVILLKKDAEKKQVGFGMKASYFEDDVDSDDDDASVEDEGDDDDAMVLDDFNSDDENYVSKLTAKMNTLDDNESEESDQGDDNDDDDNSDDDSEGEGDENNSDDDASDEEEDEDENEADDDNDEDSVPQLDTNVGFNWNGENDTGLTAPDESDDHASVSSVEDENGKSKSYKSRQKQAQRQKEEQEISRREVALADGTADENPESAADFERMLAGEPNSSELWIRYMAFYLSMANIPAARTVANRAFDRIEFRQEKEKLNVWCALLTLELKFGTDATLQVELDRACQHNNPKHVHLRLCEMMVKHQASNPSSEILSRTDATFVKMCSKFRSKKTVWIAHVSYLLEQGRFDEAQKVVQKALLSLPSYKHVETLSKYAILSFAHDQVTIARTVFDGLLTKYPKRLDLFFVYADQEIKCGNIAVARSLFQRVASRGQKDLVGVRTAATNDDTLSALKYNDKQMKRLFKKWYAFEEAHGTDANQECVKEVARAYVESSMQ